MTPSRARLLATAASLEQGVGGPLRTLDPLREQATALVDVHARALAKLDGDARDELDVPLAEGLCGLALAQLDAFPANVFWDLDLIAIALVDQVRPRSPTRAATELSEQFAAMIELQQLYGRATPINFSYVHDFTYGFDWAKHVAREPSLHDDVPAPFSPQFLAYMRTRALELLELIAADDDKYPSLPGDQARNPFPFSREPEAEFALHRELARRDLIPVPTWNPDAIDLDWSQRWRVPYQDRRIEVARELGLTRD